MRIVNEILANPAYDLALVWFAVGALLVWAKWRML